MFVYSLGDEFCSSYFIGDRDTALASGYKEVSNEMYDKLISHDAHWVDGELVLREKTEEEIAEETYRAHREAVEAELIELHSQLAAMDYIGVKIATGRATREEYSYQISEMSRLAARINELEAENES